MLGRNDMLKPQEIAQIGLALWYLPLDKVAEVRDLVLLLKKECGYEEAVDDSDEWTDEDRRDIQDASMKRWEQREEPDRVTSVRYEDR
jgi:hypothetical protein